MHTNPEPFIENELVHDCLKVGCADEEQRWPRGEQGPVFRNGCRWRRKRLC